MVGLIGALIGGTIGAYMPPNTTFTADSIMKGLTYELNQVNAGVAAIKEDSGLSMITSLIPALGAAMAQQPNLGRGPADQQGPYRPPPPPPAVIPEAPKPASTLEGMAGMDVEKPKDGTVPKPAESIPKPAEAPKPNESKPKSGGMAGMEMAPPPSAGPPKPAPPPNVAPAEPKMPSPVVPSAPLVPNVPAVSSTPSFPGLEDAAPVAAPPMSGMEGIGGHGQGGKRRR